MVENSVCKLNIYLNINVDLGVLTSLKISDNMGLKPVNYLRGFEAGRSIKSKTIFNGVKEGHKTKISTFFSFICWA
jgi:hypothetical protein